jgi:hypothetical protein
MAVMVTTGRQWSRSQLARGASSGIDAGRELGGAKSSPHSGQARASDGISSRQKRHVAVGSSDDARTRQPPSELPPWEEGGAGATAASRALSWGARSDRGPNAIVLLGRRRRSFAEAAGPQDLTRLAARV